MMVDADPSADPFTFEDRCRAIVARRRTGVGLELLASMERVLFRSELARTVRSASPLAVAAANFAGTTLDDVVGRLSPQRRIHRARGATVRRRFPDASRVRAGAAIEIPGASTARIVVRGHSIEVSISMAGASLSTHHGLLALVVIGDIPDTIVASAVGRRLRDIVEHPLLELPDLRVTACEREDLFGRHVLFRATAGSIPYVVPWARSGHVPHGGGAARS